MQKSVLGDQKTSLSSIDPASNRKRVHFLGCPVECLNLEGTVVEVNRIIKARQPSQHCVINAGKVVLMHRDPLLKKIVESCALINADGQSVVWALKFLGTPIPERVAGIDLMERLLEEANAKKYRVFFLGATQAVLDKLLVYVRGTFPLLQVAGSQHGYFDGSENEAVVRAISNSKADILFVAMGSPKKEYWLADNLRNLEVPFCMGVGGSFDVIAGFAKRAPRWIQKIGMEWFFRFIQEPRRLWRRYWVDNFIFVYLIIVDVLRLKAHLKKQNTEELLDKEIT